MMEILPKFGHTSKIGVTLEPVQSSFSTRFMLRIGTILYHIKLLRGGQEIAGVCGEPRR